MENVKTRKRALRNPLKAIRAKCLECCGGSPKEVRLCSDTNCALHPFRKGQNPFPRRKKSSRKSLDNHSQNPIQQSPLQAPKMIQLSLL